jgi:hypothetical protein
MVDRVTCHCSCRRHQTESVEERGPRQRLPRPLRSCIDQTLERIVFEEHSNLTISRAATCNGSSLYNSFPERRRNPSVIGQYTKHVTKPQHHKDDGFTFEPVMPIFCDICTLGSGLLPLATSLCTCLCGYWDKDLRSAVDCLQQSRQDVFIVQMYPGQCEAG